MNEKQIERDENEIFHNRRGVLQSRSPCLQPFNHNLAHGFVLFCFVSFRMVLFIFFIAYFFVCLSDRTPKIYVEFIFIA